MKSIDAPHYDAQRTTWAPTSDIVNMFQDTLVALDWDGKTPIPYLAKSWTDQPGRQDSIPSSCATTCTFCSGKKFTAEDVVYSFKRLKDPAIKGPYRLARRQHQGTARARSLHRRVRARRAVLRAAAAAHHVHQRDPQQGERGGAGQGLRRQGRRRHRPVVLRLAGSRAPRSCSSATTPTNGAPRCTRTRGR